MARKHVHDEWVNWEGWRDSDMNDESIRHAFADYLEERGDWRAAEIRRLWTLTNSNGNYLFSGSVQLAAGYKDMNAVVSNLFCFNSVCTPDTWEDQDVTI